MKGTEAAMERRILRNVAKDPMKETPAIAPVVTKPLAILDEDGVQKATSLSRSTRWRMERRGQFPKRVRLSPGRVGWHQSEIEAWICSRVA
jgi:prophage regulatory protein